MAHEIEALGIFDKYVKDGVRDLPRDVAITMMQTEFQLSPEQAASMFEAFDIDQNNTLSFWEYEQFYHIVGDNAQAIVQKFKEMDTDNSGQLDVDEARTGLSQLKTTSGRALTNKEIEFFIKSTSGQEGLIDLGHFATLLFRLKVYKPSS